MNGEDRYADHEVRIIRLEVSVEYIIKRLDDLERRMEQGFRDLRLDMRWLIGLTTGILFTAQLATIGLILRSHHLL